MEHAEVSRRRRMVRRFDPERAVPSAALDELVAAALRAPSAGDTQGVSLLVLETPPAVSAYWSATARPGPADRWLQGMRTAPALILVWTSREAYLDRYAEPDKGWSDRDPARWAAPYWYVDGGMTGMAVLLAAVDLGLGACFFGLPPDRTEAVRTAFEVPAEQLSVGVVAVGHPAPGSTSGGRRRRRRKAPAERTHHGHWGPSSPDGDLRSV